MKGNEKYFDQLKKHVKYPPLTIKDITILYNLNVRLKRIQNMKLKRTLLKLRAYPLKHIYKVSMCVLKYRLYKAAIRQRVCKSITPWLVFWSIIQLLCFNLVRIR